MRDRSIYKIVNKIRMSSTLYEIISSLCINIMNLILQGESNLSFILKVRIHTFGCTCGVVVTTLAALHCATCQFPPQIIPFVIIT